MTVRIVKRTAVILLVMCMCLSQNLFCLAVGSGVDMPLSQKTNGAEVTQEAEDAGDVLSRVLVLHYAGDGYKETVSHLNNSLLASKSIDCHDIMTGLLPEDVEGYSCIYVDETVLDYHYKDYLYKVLEKAVRDGAGLFLPNEAAHFFPTDFLGIKNTVTLDGVPQKLTNAAKGTDLEDIGSLVCDFALLFEGYTDYELFSKSDFGSSFVPSSAIPVVTDAYGNAVYTVNKHGDGFVMLTNPLLPNTFNVNSFERVEQHIYQYPFAASSAGANSLLKGMFASYIEKQKYGFTLERTFGSYGTQPIAWQLHYEEITGIENNASVIFSEICKKYNQPPSFTLIRNTYKWFARYESISYLDIKDNICTLDFNEGAYSNGTHVIADGQNLFVSEIENTGSYFEDLKSAEQRLFPSIADMNGDGICDLVCGSSDGKIYVYITESTDGRWICKKGYALKNSWGIDIDLGSYSAPCVYDFDGDGKNDIISGDADGNISFVKNNGTSFDNPTIVVSGIGTKTMPVMGDIDNDKNDELVVGTCDGRIYSFEMGKGYIGTQTLLCERENEGFMSPCVYDINGDGRNDLLAGTYDGYVMRFVTSGDRLLYGGYIMANEKNYKGNSRVKFGNNASPRFFDADGDGENELVCGSYEYGLNVPVDSEYFEYKSLLQSQVDYILSNGFYLGVHFYTNAHASAEREKEELRLHKEALSKYGINTEGIGVNQHTWYTSSNSHTQTLESVRDSQFLWDSGWQSAGSNTAPQSSTENVLGFPAFIDEKNKMLAFNTATLLYLDDEISDITAKYSLPVSIYYHCDFAYNNKKGAENDVKRVADYVKRNNMSFVCEDAFAKMCAASSNLNVLVKFGADDSFTLVPTEKIQDYPLRDEMYRDAVAVKLTPCVGENAAKYSSDAEMFLLDASSLTMTLNKAVTVEKSAYLKSDKKAHLVSVNVPSKINYGNGMVTVKPENSAYVEIKVKGDAQCTAKGIEREYDGAYTTFRGFGINNASIVYN